MVASMMDMIKLSNMIVELSKKQDKQHNTLIREMKAVKEKLIDQGKAITGLEESLAFLGRNLKNGQDANKAINKEMADVKLINEELTKKMAEIEKEGKACDTKLNKMDNWLQGNNVDVQGIPVSENNNVEEVALKIPKKDPTNSLAADTASILEEETDEEKLVT